ncbi:MAG: cysteine desulfurase/selenocysteine lyase [Desulforhopalus sp.]|jgi:cysteine desulfurase/selenocysteine lyase
MIYLDNAATTWPKHRKLFEEMVDKYMEIGVSPGRGSYDQAMLADDCIREARNNIARFFKAPDSDQVIFTANATDGLNQFLLGLLQEGSRVLSTRLEHNSVLRPLYHLQQKKGVETSLVSFDKQGFVNPEDMREALDKALVKKEAVDLVVCNHVSNVLGTVQQVAEIGSICEEYGVAFLVDCSQSAGHVPVDMERMKASAIVFTGHKSLYGPTGIGGLILNPNLEIASTRFGGTGVESKSLRHTQSFPYKHEAGTHNLMGIIGLSLAIDNLIQKDVVRLHKEECALAQRLYQGLQKIPGIRLYGGTAFQNNDNVEDDRQIGLFSATFDTISSEDLSAILDGDFDIAVRSGLHCAPLVHETLGTAELGSIRFSLGQFNTELEIDQTIEAMIQITSLSNT